MVVQTHSSLETDLGCSGTSLLGGDENYTVGGSCAVDGRGSGILENVHRLDVLRVDVLKARLAKHPIDHNQWGTASVPVRAATERDARCGVRTTGVVSHLQS